MAPPTGSTRSVNWRQDPTVPEQIRKAQEAPYSIWAQLRDSLPPRPAWVRSRPEAYNYSTAVTHTGSAAAEDQGSRTDTGQEQAPSADTVKEQPPIPASKGKGKRRLQPLGVTDPAQVRNLSDGLEDDDIPLQPKPQHNFRKPEKVAVFSSHANQSKRQRLTNPAPVVSPPMVITRAPSTPPWVGESLPRTPQFPSSPPVARSSNATPSTPTHPKTASRAETSAQSSQTDSSGSSTPSPQSLPDLPGLTSGGTRPRETDSSDRSSPSLQMLPETPMLTSGGARKLPEKLKKVKHCDQIIQYAKDHPGKENEREAQKAQEIRASLVEKAHKKTMRKNARRKEDRKQPKEVRKAKLRAKKAKKANRVAKSEAARAKTSIE